ncbi:MAG: PilW family protein [Propionivibrio sp.]|nr:PilW family protein [Propionivibrio sp.]MBL8412809.1 PilW family protein [Propionivibrio sp.]
MVAMVIGLLGIIVMMQMFSVFEGQKRTTGGGDDAISSGAVSLYGAQRNIQQSGWGISSVEVIGCTVTGLVVGAAPIPLIPVTINSPLITGQDANTDTLLIVSGNGNGSVEGDTIASVPAANAYDVGRLTGFSAGPPPDRVVAVPQTRPAPCNLALTTVTGVVFPNVLVSAGFAGIVPGDKLFNLGTAPTVRAYAVRNQNLTVCDYTTSDCGLAANNGDTTVWVPVANNVVSLRAQYGRDNTDMAAAMDGVVDVWDQTRPVPAFPAGSNTANACALIRASAVRIVLVARSSQPEKTADWPALTAHVTPAAPLWAGSAAAAISLPDPDPTWPTGLDFRYKVFQTVVPLRNVHIPPVSKVGPPC